MGGKVCEGSRRAVSESFCSLTRVICFLYCLEHGVELETMMSLNQQDEATETQLLGSVVIHHSQDAIFLVSPDHRIYFANPAASQLLGYTEKEFLDRGLAAILSPDQAMFPKDLAAGDVARVERWLRRKNGRRVKAEITLARFRVGTEQRIAMMVTDLSREREYDYGRRLGEAIAAEAPLLVYVTDESWNVLWANQNKALSSGYAITELLGRPAPLRRYLGGEDPKTLTAIERDLEHHGKWTGEVYTRRRSGQLYPLYGTISVVEGLEPGECHRIVMLRDVSTIRETERMLRHVSLFDPTTGLPNRAYFERKAERALGRAMSDRSSLALLLLDIDGFRAINETLGYVAADQVLQQFSERLKTAVGDDCLLARHTSDSFVLMVEATDAVVQVASITDTIQRRLHIPFDVRGNRVTLSASLGVSCFPEDGATVDALLMAAESALRWVKEEGGDGFSFYRKGAEARSRRFIELATPIREGLASGEFVPYFQPIIDSESREVVAMEALARWHPANGSRLTPAEFIPVAERSGLIGELSDHILRQACRHLRRLDELGYHGKTCGVNLSARQFRDAGFANRVLDIVTGEGISPERICLEITESLVMDRPSEKAEILAILQSQGMRVVIDDFGTGYSSFAYLKQFDIDGVKVDRVFVQDVPGNRKAEKLVCMMLALGRELDIPVVAEGVETEGQAQFLRSHGCRRMQGYLFAHPLSGDDLVALLARHSSRS